jgi:hypothetical protein
MTSDILSVMRNVKRIQVTMRSTVAAIKPPTE